MHLSKIQVQNYKGIDNLEVSFSPDINIIIGENGSCKSALVDAIRLLYVLGEPRRSIVVEKEDFFQQIVFDKAELKIDTTECIKIAYEFRGLTPKQKGAFYEYMVPDLSNRANDFARIEIQYKQDNRYPLFSYSTGNIAGQRADSNTFRLFQHYYLGALRDSTKDLLSTRGNILGKVIKRLVDRNQSEADIKQIIRNANKELLKRDEVISTRENINKNLNSIYKNVNQSQIGLQIEQSKIEYIVNVIKPYLPHDRKNISDEGFYLWQNSLGFNNLIYIATVLGDIEQRVKDDAISHFILLIEEPEAHIHPQLQLSLYNFLKDANKNAQSQLFITTHSPTLTSRVPFDNLILLDKNAYTIGDCFKDRVSDAIVQDTTTNTALNKLQIDEKKAQLQRYIDVTKSQMFYAKACLFVEGISEELLITAFAEVEGFALEDYRIELVNVDGISFYPFMFLFNSSAPSKRLPKRIAILTDDDRFPQSKGSEFSLDALIENDCTKLNVLQDHLSKANSANRLKNLNSVKNKQASIDVQCSYQTMELDLCICNVSDTKNICLSNLLFKYIEENHPEEFTKINDYLQGLKEPFDRVQQEKIAILLWKALPPKAQFAQKLALHIVLHIKSAKASFSVPGYIKSAFDHLRN